MAASRDVFVAGATGYIGRYLISALVADGYRVHGLTRAASEGKLPAGCVPVVGNALDAPSYRAAVPRGCTFVHLVGVAHPSPRKAAQFLSVDLASVQESLIAATRAGAGHFVYLSVAQPAPMMQAYIAARRAGERWVTSSGLSATILRPWYVLGPGHRWPLVLRPFYWLAERLPATAANAKRLGLVTIDEMVRALVRSIEYPPAQSPRVVDVPAIRGSDFL